MILKLFICFVVGVIISVADVQAGLLAAWEFNEEDRCVLSVCASGGGAANTGGVLMDDAHVSDGVLVLDGSGDYLAFGTDVSDLRGLSAMSICAWLKPGEVTNTLRRIVEHDDNFYFFQENNRYRFVIHGPGGASLTSTTTLEVGVWQHVAVVWQHNNIAKLYINGIVEATAKNPTVMMQNNAQHLSFGAQRNNSATPTQTAFFKGSLDDVAVWNHVLSDAQVGALAGKNFGGYKRRKLPTAVDAFVFANPASRIGSRDALLSGVLVSQGASAAEVSLYWGESDGGTNPLDWQNVYEFGVAEPGLLTTNLSTLFPGQVYYYRFYADDGTANGFWSNEEVLVSYLALPGDIGDLQLWLRPEIGVFADAGITLANPGDNVVLWQDSSGNERDAERTAGAGVLKFDASGLNGEPAIRISDNNSNAYLKVADFEPQAADDLTVFIVSRSLDQTLDSSALHPLITAGTPANGKGLFTISTMRPGAGGSGNLGYFGRNYDPYPYDNYTSSTSENNFGDGRGHVIALTLDAAAEGGKGLFSGWYDGAFTQSNAGKTAEPIIGPVEIGGSSHSVLVRYAGFIGDIVIYNRVLDADEFNQIGWYLQSKYQLDGEFYNPLALAFSNIVVEAIGKNNANLGYNIVRGEFPANVTLYWGLEDGGDDPAEWANTNNIGSVDSLGRVRTTIAGLLPETKYFYRIMGENEYDVTWSKPGAFFTTLRETPADLSGLQLWLRADNGIYSDAGVALASDGEVAVEWHDSSGNANNAYCVGSVGNVKYTAGYFGELPALVASDLNSGDYFNVPSYEVGDNENLTVFVVAEPHAQTLNGSAIHHVVGSGNPANGRGTFCISTTRPNVANAAGSLGYFGRNFGSNPPYSEFASAISNPNFAPGAPHIAVLTLDTVANSGLGQFVGYFDGYLRDSVAGKTSNPENGPVEIAGSSVNGSARFAGAIGEIIIYNRVLSQEEHNRVGWYLQNKYGVDAIYENPFAVKFEGAEIVEFASETAELKVDLVGGDLPAEITLYWGEIDGGEDVELWSFNKSTTAETVGTKSIEISDLMPGTIYYARFAGVNSQGRVWSESTLKFVTIGPPVVANEAPSGVAFGSASLTGALVATSGAPASVWIYWGKADGGSNTEAWESREELGQQLEGSVGAQVFDLEDDVAYYYRLYASNIYGGRWASGATKFVTPMMPENFRKKGLVLWLRADAGVEHDGGSVYNWVDQASEIGGENNAVAIGASRPSYVTDAIAGRSAIHFDGIDDILTVANHSALDLGIGSGKSWSVLVVSQVDKPASQCIVSKGTESSVTTDWRLFFESNNIIWGTGHSSDPNAWFSVTAPRIGEPHILAATLLQAEETEGTKVLYVNGEPNCSGTYSTKAAANNDPLVIGGFTQGRGNLSGYVAEVLVFNHELNNDELNNVGWYLQQKYGITGEFEFRAPRGTILIVR